MSKRTVSPFLSQLSGILTPVATESTSHRDMLLLLHLRLLLHECCVPRTVTLSLDLPSSMDNEEMRSECGSGECVQRILSQFPSLISDLDNEEHGCNAIWARVADKDAILNRTAFARDCVVSICAIVVFFSFCVHQLVGDDLVGYPCKVDNDCLPLHGCDTDTHLCDHTEEDVLQVRHSFPLLLHLTSQVLGRTNPD